MKHHLHRHLHQERPLIVAREHDNEKDEKHENEDKPQKTQPVTRVRGGGQPTPTMDPNDVTTQISLVFVTMSQTFDGPASMQTLVGDPIQFTGPMPTPTDGSAPTNTDAGDAPTSTDASVGTSVPGQIVPTSNTFQPTSLAFQTSTPLASNTAASASDATQSAQPNQSTGMSTGAIAGVVLGLLLGLGMLLGLSLFWLKKRHQKKMQVQQIDDEKSVPPKPLPPVVVPPPNEKDEAASVHTARTMSTAPRLSLRPLTQFSPNLGGDRRSKGNELNVMATGAAKPDHLSPNAAPSAWEKRGTQTNASNPANPFGDHAERPVTRDGPPSSGRITPPEPSPLPIMSNAAPLPQEPIELAAAPVIEKAAVPAPLAIGRPDGANSPAMGSPFWVEDRPMSAGSGVSSAGPNNVHRVQMEFVPSLDDEIELRVGALVRIVHEYDDGWALCARLDRSQQGVAPRTCLSKHPVKPRPNPNNQSPRPRQGPPGADSTPRGSNASFSQPIPASPMNGNGRNSPAPPHGPFNGAPLPASPASGRNSPNPQRPFQPYQVPAPLQPGNGMRSQSPSPAGRQRAMSNAVRSQSPGPYGAGQKPMMAVDGRRRSNSVGGIVEQGRRSPTGMSPMNPAAGQPQQVARKPVPGQAL